MQFTTVKSKEIDYDMYLKSEKLVHRNQENEKNVSQLFGIGKNCFLDISDAAIWREKKVDPCYLVTKKCSSQLLKARKKIMTSIKCQKICFTAINPRKKCFPDIWNWKKIVTQLFRA